MSLIALVYKGGTQSVGGSRGEATAAASPQTMFGALTLDALLNETTELNSQASRYAIEDGADVTDNITREHEKLSVAGWITAAQVNEFGVRGRSKLIGAKEALRKIQLDRLPITVVTGMDTYANMVMESCRISRDSAKGDVFDITADFVQIEKVNLRRVDVPPDKVKPGKPAQKAGTTETKAGKKAGVPPTKANGIAYDRLKAAGITVPRVIGG